MERAFFTSKAAFDLSRIAAYTAEKWGKAQAIRYLGGLRSYCGKLADHPGMGRSCTNVSHDLQRSEYEKHVIFYRRGEGGIVVSRILHASMEPSLHLLDKDL